MASKNDRERRGDLSHKNAHAREKNVAGMDKAMERGSRGIEGKPAEEETRDERRRRAGSGTQAAAQGPSGAEEIGGASASGQGEPDQDTHEKGGTGGGPATRGRKR